MFFIKFMGYSSHGHAMEVFIKHTYLYTQLFVEVVSFPVHFQQPNISLYTLSSDQHEQTKLIADVSTITTVFFKANKKQI